MALATELSVLYEPLKYLKYSVLFFSFFFLLVGKFKVQLEVLPFVFLILFNLLKIWQIDERTMIELFFIFTAISIFFVTKPSGYYLKHVNFLLAILFFGLFFTDLNLKFDLNSFLISDTSSTETNISSFLFSLFFTYFLIKKDVKWVLFNLVMVILTFKRITFLSVIVVSFFYFLKDFKIFNKVIFYVILNLLFVMLVSFLAIGQYDDLIMEYTGVPTGHFTQGRSVFLKIVLDGLGDERSEAFIIGLGQGSLIEKVEYGLGYFTLFHNDVFKLFWESGILFFILFFHLLYKYNNKILAVQFNIFMLTDNVLIYTPVLFIFLLLSILLKQQQTKKYVRISI